ncbi:MAG: 2OG-Fe(II) oxygenase [Terriglobales bacterium]
MGKIQIHRAGLTVSASPAELESLSQQFQERHVIVLEEFLEPGLLAQVQEAMGRAQFLPRTHKDIRLELCMAKDSVAVHMLLLVANNPQLFALIQQITRCPPLGYYVGRIYRLPPAPEYFDRWHDDVGDARQIGMSINLGAEPYEGGLLEVRKGRKLVGRFANPIPGNALLFRIRKGLQHRVTAVKGSAPKTAFAGWFIDQACSTPYLESFRGMVSPKTDRC